MHSSARFPIPAIAGAALAILLSACTTGTISPVASNPPPTFTISGSVSGLTSGMQVALADNAGAPLAASNGTFTFPDAVSDAYSVTVVTQPSGQSCSVANYHGAGLTANVANVKVTCSTNTFTVAGKVTGLANGAQVAIQDSGSDTVTVTQNGGFSFGTPIPFNGTYAATILAQPAGQTCSIANGTGAGVVANISNIHVTCSTNAYSIGGSVSGLAQGAQVTLFDNGGDPATVSADGGFSFATRIPFNGTYAVSIASQPAGQTCTVGNGSGAGVVAAVGNVTVTCAATTYTVGGSVSGLTQGMQVTLLNNGADTATATANGVFTFAIPVAFNGSYLVTIGTQPVGQTCTVSNFTGSGVVANVTSIQVTCSTNTFTISGSETGLLGGAQVTLLDNGADPLTLYADGAFSFAAPVAYGSSSAVTVGTQPVGQTCSAANYTHASVAADVSDIAVTCSVNSYAIGGTVSGLAQGAQVTLLNNGADAVTVAANGAFTFATPVVYAGAYAVTVGTQPNSAICAVTNGAGTTGASVTTVAITCQPGYFAAWDWVSGPTTAAGNGVYGTQGVADPANIPGSRGFASSWIDQSGNLWLFGGQAGIIRNDLWKFDRVSGQWTWVSGSSAGGAAGVYGSQGVADPSNVPSARTGASSWIDQSGNLWLFGGFANGFLNDLWMYNPTTDLWTWEGGSSTQRANGSGVLGAYGTQGVPAVGNFPGGRTYASSWTDAAGNFWLFGGYGWDTDYTEWYFNDLWTFNPTSGQWTWVSGSNSPNAVGLYGTQGTAAAGNVPGGRKNAATWLDPAGSLWLFGGKGYDAPGSVDNLNDLWKFNPVSGQWVWVTGSSTVNAVGVYGTQNLATAGDSPGARFGAASWTDSSGNLWMLGGLGNSGIDNDLWEFIPTSGSWIWVNGSNMASAPGVYGSQGVAAYSNTPGGRFGSAAWVDGAGSLWLFGGAGYDGSGAYDNLNDLWKFTP